MNVDCAVVPRRTAALARPGRRARWRARVRQCVRQCALLCAGLLAAGMPQAATVSAPDEPPGQATALRDPALRGGLAGPGVLDKALTGSVATGGKNLDLLLEMQRSDTAEASQPVPVRPGTAPTPAAIAPAAITLAAKTLTAATLPQAGAPPEQSALSQSNLLGSDASLGTQPAATRNTEWAGGGGLAGGGRTDTGTAGGRSSMDDRGSGRPHDEADDGSLRFWPRHARDFIRDNREWLLGGIAGLLLLGAAARAYGSRRR